MSTSTVEHDASPEAYETGWQQRCELVNWAGITYRYHRKRQRFFDVCDKLVQATALTGGVLVAGKELKISGHVDAPSLNNRLPDESVLWDNMVDWLKSQIENGTIDP